MEKPFLFTYSDGYERFSTFAELKEFCDKRGLNEKYYTFKDNTYDSMDQCYKVVGLGCGRYRNVTVMYQPKIVSVTVYFDTVKEDYDETKDGENLIDIELPENVLYDWFFKNIDDGCHECVTNEEVFNQWLCNYTADDTVDLYDTLKNFITPITLD